MVKTGVKTLAHIIQKNGEIYLEEILVEDHGFVLRLKPEDVVTELSPSLIVNKRVLVLSHHVLDTLSEEVDSLCSFNYQG